jgi:hypothetical protein
MKKLRGGPKEKQCIVMVPCIGSAPLQLMAVREVDPGRQETGKERSRSATRTHASGHSGSIRAAAMLTFGTRFDEWRTDWCRRACAGREQVSWPRHRRFPSAHVGRNTFEDRNGADRGEDKCSGQCSPCLPAIVGFVRAGADESPP